MRELPDPDPVLLFCGLLSSAPRRLEDAARALIGSFGPLCERSALLPWDFSRYYAAELGEPLFRQFLFFDQKISPAELASAKLKTRAIELETARTCGGHPCRTVNLDPGYLAPAKVVLATTKDYAHRVYLSRGIFAEVALFYRQHSFQSLPHTYPDFRTDAYLQIFNAARRRILPIHSPPEKAPLHHPRLP